MSYLLKHLNSGWEVDQAILSEEDKLVVKTKINQIIRFGITDDTECLLMDEILLKVEEEISELASIYVVDITEVPDFNTMYELYDPVTVMFFYRYLLIFKQK